MRPRRLGDRAARRRRWAAVPTAALLSVLATGVVLTVDVPAAAAADGDIVQFAGLSGAGGFSGDGGLAIAAQLLLPSAMAVAPDGATFIADTSNHRVRRVDAAGIIDTVAGDGHDETKGDGTPAIEARLDGPSGIAVDSLGRVYVSESDGNVIRRFTPGGVIETIAGTGSAASGGDGGPATDAAINRPMALTIDSSGRVYVAESGGHRIRRFTPGGTIETVAGTGVAGALGDGGPAAAAQLRNPMGITLLGDDIVIADTGNHRVRRVATDGTITRWGRGLDTPIDVAAADAGSVFVSDAGTDRVQRLHANGGFTLVAGTGVAGGTGDNGPATQARLRDPSGLTVTPGGDLLIGGAVRVRRVLGAANPIASGSVIGSVPPASAGWTTTVDIGRFDPTLGTLTKIDISLSGRVDGRLAYENLDDQPRNVAGHLGADITLRRPDSSVLAASAPGVTRSDALPAFDGTSDFGGTSGQTYDPLTDTSTVSTTLVSPADLVAFTGSGSVSLPISSASSSTVLSAGPVDRDVVTSATAVVVVTYTWVEIDAPPAPPSITGTPTSPGKDATPTWAFTVPAGLSADCSVDGSLFAACSSPFDADLSAASDGSHVFEVRANDGNGGISPPVLSTYVLDRVAPAVPVLTITPGSPSNQTTPSWSFTTEPGSSAQCSVDGGAYVGCTSPFASAFTTDGIHTLDVRAIDLATNTSAAVRSTYDLDRAAPAAPVVTSSPPTPGGDTTPTWSFTSEAGSSTSCAVDGGAWTLCASPFTADLTAAADGSHTFEVRATDTASNPSLPAASVYLLDRVAPPAPVITIRPGSPGSEVRPSWSFTAEAGATTECRIDWAPYVPCTSPHSFDLSTLSDGDHTFDVRAIDVAGNVSTPASAVYRLDRTAPATPIITGTPTSPGNTDDPEWTFTVESGSSAVCRIYGVTGAWKTCTSPYVVDLAAEADDSYTFEVRAVDAAGNRSAVSSSDYVLDRVAPAAPTIVVEPAAVANDATPTWEFTVPSDASASCSIDGGPFVACASPFALDLSASLDGPVTLTLKATDAAGNESADTVSTFLLDRFAPAAPVFTVEPAWTGFDVAPAWAFTVADGTAECQVDGGGFAPCADTFSMDLSTAADGSHTLDVRTVDGAGNTSASTTGIYVLDRVAPSAPDVTTSPSSPGNDRSPTWRFLGDEGTVLECSYATGSWTACASPLTLDLADAEDGTFDLALRALDEAGNASEAVAMAYELDTRAPGVPVIRLNPPATPAGAPTWKIASSPGTTMACSLAGSPWESCRGSVTGPAGEVVQLRVRAIDAAGNISAVVSSTYHPATAIDAPTSHEGGGGVPAPASGFGDTPLPRTDAPLVVEHAPRPDVSTPDADLGPSAPRPFMRPPQPNDAVIKQVSELVDIVIKRSASPLVLIVIVILFIGVQNWIDRSDPKLATAAAAHTGPDFMTFE